MRAGLRVGGLVRAVHGQGFELGHPCERLHELDEADSVDPVRVQLVQLDHYRLADTNSQILLLRLHEPAARADGLKLLHAHKGLLSRLDFQPRVPPKDGLKDSPVLLDEQVILLPEQTLIPPSMVVEPIRPRHNLGQQLLQGRPVARTYPAFDVLLVGEPDQRFHELVPDQAPFWVAGVAFPVHGGRGVCGYEGQVDYL